MRRRLSQLYARLARAGYDPATLGRWAHGARALLQRHGLFMLWAMAFCALGINRYVAYVPLFALAGVVTLVLSWRHSRLRPYVSWLPSPSLVSVVGLALCATLSVYLLGLWSGQLSVGSHAVVTTTFALVMAAWVLQRYDYPQRQRLLSAYVLGIAFQVLLLCVHNMGPELANLRGRGMLEDPFDGHRLNSPAPSNLAAIVFAWAWYMAVSAKRWWQVALAVLFAQVLLLVGVFFAGRAFFIVIPLIIGVVGLYHWRWRGLLRSLLALLLVFVPMAIIYALSAPLQEFAQLALDRLFDRGLRSARWPLLVDGWQKLLAQPWGGFEPNQRIVRMPWFHNLFLDMARIAGWLPVVAVAAVIGLMLRGVWQQRGRGQLLPILLALVSFALMQQDVILEGNPRLFILFVFCAVLLVCRRDGGPQEGLSRPERP